MTGSQWRALITGMTDQDGSYPAERFLEEVRGSQADPPLVRVQ